MFRSWKKAYLRPALWVLSGSLCLAATLQSLRLTKAQESSLRSSVDNFWKAWQQQDYTKAAQAVIPEQKSAFLRVRKFPVRKWKLERLEAGSQPGRIRVTVAVERFEPFMGRYFEWNHVAEWMESGSQWLLIMPSIR